MLAKAVRRQRLDRVDDTPRGRPCGFMRTIWRGSAANRFSLIGGEGMKRMLGALQPIAEAARVQNRLRGAVRADRIHWVRGVPQ